MSLFSRISKKIYGTKNEKDIRRLLPFVAAINALESEMMALPEPAFAERTEALRKRCREKGESLDSLLPEAFALVREAARRKLGERHYDVQLMGGIVLHDGKITEMKTGEGKTLSCVTAAYLNSLSGEGVHVVTVNDYLAQRDADWMRPPSEQCFPTWITMPSGRRTAAISLTEPTTSSVLIICAITWRGRLSRKFNAVTITALSMKSTRF